MDKINLGTIGSGVIVHAFLDNVKITEGISLAAVYSRSRKTGISLYLMRMVLMKLTHSSMEKTGSVM